MEEKIRSRLGLGFICIMLIAMSMSAACSIINPQFTITLKAERVNEIIQSAIISGVTSQTGFRVTGIDMKGGLIRVTVEYISDESKVAGSYDVRLKLVDGSIQAEITDVNLPGIVLDQAVLDQIAELITAEIATATSQITGRVDIISVSVLENSIQIVMHINPR